MSKLDIFGLPRSERLSSEKPYREAGHALSLTLRWPNASDRALASEDAAELVRNFITGDGERGVCEFPDPDVIPSATLFNACALVAVMQAPAPGGAKYGAIELAVLSARLPRTWIAIQRDVNRILMEGDAASKNSQGGSTASSAVMPSPSIPNIP
jgi:hypothetical protein